MSGGSGGVARETGVVVWITGIPASGKTTLALRARARMGAATVVLDSDEMRQTLGDDSYEPEARDRFYRQLARLAALLAGQGLVVLVAATANRRAHRALARELAPRFVEVWVRASVDEAARRDPKGLYARAALGEAPRLPGAGENYEPPESPEVVAQGGLDDAAIDEIVRLTST